MNRYILGSIQSKFLIPIIIFSIFSMISTILYLYSTNMYNAELVGIATAKTLALQVQNFKSFYNEIIINGIKNRKIKISPDHIDNNDTLIPDSSSLVNMLGASFEKKYPGISMRLYSHFPVNNKKIESHDKFKLEAFRKIEKDPSQPYYKLEEVNGRLSVRYAVAEVMNDFCIECYNADPQSPKKNWKKSDVRGVLEVIIPVNDATFLFSITALKPLGSIGISLFSMAFVLILVCRKAVIRPIKSISETNERILSGDLKARVVVYSRDEIGAMAYKLNVLLDHFVNLIDTKQVEHDNMQGSIMKLLEEVSDAATGDLTVEASVTEDMTGAIADSFNHMIYQLRQLVHNVQRATTNVSSSANQIRQNAEILAQGSTTQAEQILDSASALDEMAVSIQQVSENASLSSTVAEQSLNNARSGSIAVQNTIQVMNRMKDKIEETSNCIKSLGERSKEIGEVVNLIAEIADRTSVLALNASIEASLAGEAGQGFAIVAHEVERLAIRASDATKQIHSLVDAIQSETQKAIIAMEESTSEVGNGSKVTDQAGKALREIETVCHRLSDLIQLIFLASEQQARGSEDLSKAMNEISNITQQTATGNKYAAHSIHQLVDLADELGESVRTFKLPR